MNNVKIQQWKTQAGYDAIVTERTYVSMDLTIKRLYGYVQVPPSHVYHGKHVIPLGPEHEAIIEQKVSCTGNMIPRETDGWWIGFEVSETSAQNPITSCESLATVLKKIQDKKTKNVYITTGTILIVIALAVYYLVKGVLAMGANAA